jgi:hypothetical protein
MVLDEPWQKGKGIVNLSYALIGVCPKGGGGVWK